MLKFINLVGKVIELLIFLLVKENLKIINKN